MFWGQPRRCLLHKCIAQLFLVVDGLQRVWCFRHCDLLRCIAVGYAGDHVDSSSGYRHHPGSSRSDGSPAGLHQYWRFSAPRHCAGNLSGSLAIISFIHSGTEDKNSNNCATFLCVY